MAADMLFRGSRTGGAVVTLVAQAGAEGVFQTRHVAKSTGGAEATLEGRATVTIKSLIHELTSGAGGRFSA